MKQVNRLRIIVLATIMVCGVFLSYPQCIFANVYYDIQTYDVPSSYGFSTSIHSINNNGYIVGTYSISQPPPLNFASKSFTLDGTTFTSRAWPNATDTNVLDTNDAKYRVGYYDIKNNSGVVTQEHGFYNFNATVMPPSPGQVDAVTYDSVAFTRAIGINNYNQIVGRFTDAQGAHGFLYEISNNVGSFTRIYDYPGAFGTGLTDINDVGQKSGVYVDSHGYRQSFVLNNSWNVVDSSSTALGPLHDTWAMKLNNNGLVVGYLDNQDLYATNSPYYDAVGFVHRIGYNGSENTFDIPGATWTRIWGINDANVIVGDYLMPGTGLHGFIARVNVPEPATMLLLCLGLTGLAGVRRKFRI